jgi:hypothetical protein
MVGALYCRHGAAISIPSPFLLSYSRLDLFRVSGRWKEKATGQAGGSQHSDFRRPQQVPWIGPATAEKILQIRKPYGAFKSVDDLLAIRGLSPKRLEKMRKYLVAGKPNSKNMAPAAGCSGCAKPKAPPGKSPVETSAQPASSQTAGDPEESPL